MKNLKNIFFGTGILALLVIVTNIGTVSASVNNNYWKLQGGVLKPASNAWSLEMGGTAAEDLDMNGYDLTDVGSATLGTTTTASLNGVIVVDGVHYAQTGAGIQAAINAASAQGGGTVYLPNNTYRLPLNTATPAHYNADYAGLILYENVSLVGESRDGVVLEAPSFYATSTDLQYVALINDVAGIANVHVKNVSIELPQFLSGGSAYWGHGIQLNGASDVSIENVKVTNGCIGFQGETVSFSTTTLQLTTDAEHIFVDNLECDQFLGSAELRGGKDVVIQNSEFYGAEDDSLLVAETADQLRILNNVFDGQDTADGGIANGHIYLVNDTAITDNIAGIQNVLISGNTFKRAVTSSSGVAFSRVKNVTISKNIIADNPSSGIKNGGGSSTSENVRIVDNSIYGNGDDGINVQVQNASGYMHNVFISRNDIYNNTDVGIYVNSDLGNKIDNLQITDNILYDDQDTPAQSTDILVRAGIGPMTRVTVAGNKADTVTRSEVSGGTIEDVFALPGHLTIGATTTKNSASVEVTTTNSDSAFYGTWKGDSTNSKYGYQFVNSGSASWTGDGSLVRMSSLNGSDSGKVLEVNSSGVNLNGSVARIVKYGSGVGHALEVVNQGSSAALKVTNNSTGYALITTSGNVGIGTTTPSTKLDVYNATATSSAYIYSGGAGLGGRLILEDVDAAGCTEITALNGTLTAKVVACP